MEKPKTLPPVLRENERYIVFEIITEEDIEYEEFTKALWLACLSFLGELYTSEAEIKIIKNLYNPRTKQGVIKCRYDMTEFVRASLALINKIGNKDAIVKVLGITGTISSAKRKYLGFTELESFWKEEGKSVA
ncbi:MAG: ribonuclease P protein component 2 [Candidatus Aenigmarchaeota archaeon]|nr:ribonuclease P protein component 2 [Candidatus Aenigmarchaeota archaeon]